MVEIQLTTVWIYKLRYQLVYKATYSHGSLSEGRISPARKSWCFLPFCRDSHIEKPFGVWRHLIIHPVHIMRWKGYWAPSMLWWDSMSRGPQGVGNGQPQRQIEGSKTSVAFEDLSIKGGRPNLGQDRQESETKNGLWHEHAFNNPCKHCLLSSGRFLCLLNIVRVPSLLSTQQNPGRQVKTYLQEELGPRNQKPLNRCRMTSIYSRYNFWELFQEPYLVFSPSLIKKRPKAQRKKMTFWQFDWQLWSSGATIPPPPNQNQFLWRIEPQSYKP